MHARARRACDGVSRQFTAVRWYARLVIYVMFTRDMSHTRPTLFRGRHVPRHLLNFGASTSVRRGKTARTIASPRTRSIPISIRSPTSEVKSWNLVCARLRAPVLRVRRVAPLSSTFSSRSRDRDLNLFLFHSGV